MDGAGPTPATEVMVKLGQGFIYACMWGLSPHVYMYVYMYVYTYINNLHYFTVLIHAYRYTCTHQDFILDFE